MKLFDVYPLFDINIVRGKGCHVWDEQGTEYLDLYGGHAVISIGHAHPHYVEMISKQVATLGFYSNSVINKLQTELAERLGKACGYDDYQLFLINSGAEANENARLRLRRLPVVPHQQRRGSQRERAEAGLLPQRADTHRQLRQGLPRTHIPGRGGDGQPENHRPGQCLRTRHLPAPERHGSHARRASTGRRLRRDY